MSVGEQLKHAPLESQKIYRWTHEDVGSVVVVEVAGFRCTWWQSSMYSAGGSQGLIQSLHFSGLFVFQNAVSAVVYND
jgi:hypothetical protein